MSTRNINIIRQPNQMGDADKKCAGGAQLQSPPMRSGSRFGAELNYYLIDYITIVIYKLFITLNPFGRKLVKYSLSSHQLSSIWKADSY